MNTSTPSAASSGHIDDLYRLVLADGLKLTSEGKTIIYRVVRLRETGVKHERAAIRQAERVMVVQGAPRLLVSDSEFRFALTTQHIEAFECDGQRIHGPAIDLDMVGNLTTHDFGLIEQRVFLIGCASAVRYGTLSPEDFALLLAGGKTEDSPPQPVGQTSSVGADAAADGAGPAMLTDFTGSGAGGQASGLGG